MSGLRGRLAWHARAAWRAGRIAAAIAFVGGLLLPLLLEVDGQWLVLAVAAGCALAAVSVLVAAPDVKSPARDVLVALEAAGAANQVAHALLRAALLLTALAAGLAVGDQAA
jgi:hypothetical protein